MSPWIHDHPDCVAEGLSPRLRHSSRVLHVEGSTLYVSRGLQLFRSSDGGATFQKIGCAPGDLFERSLARRNLTARVFRTGFQGLAPLPSGELIASVRGAMLHGTSDEAGFTCSHRITRGKRPLNVCVHPSGRSYFGEYFSNPGREEVHIFGSDTGRQWEIVGTFPEGTVRHVHGIVWDPFRKGQWVLTGDDGDEAALWWTDDEFRTLEPVLRGTQNARAVTVIPLESGLIVPMDTPFETNYVQHFSPQTGELEALAPVAGSVFHSGRTRGLYLLSTAVEKSSINTDPRPALYASSDGYDWTVIARFRRDLPRLAQHGSLFQWPTLVLPTGMSSLETIFASGQALQGAHERLLTWSEADVLAEIPVFAQRSSA